MNSWFGNPFRNYGYGKKTFTREKVNLINENGSVKLEEAHVTSSVNVNGRLEATNSKIASANINGHSFFSNCTIENKSTVNGSIKSVGSKFFNLLSVSSERVCLESSFVDKLDIRQVNGFTGIQVVELRNGSQINSSVHFESGQGEIWLYDESKITGSVVGANVIHK